jgi:hypothetical protein
MWISTFSQISSSKTVLFQNEVKAIAGSSSNKLAPHDGRIGLLDKNLFIVDRIKLGFPHVRQRNILIGPKWKTFSGVASHLATIWSVENTKRQNGKSKQSGIHLVSIPGG